MSDSFYRIDAHDEYINGAYDENGDGVICDLCSGDMAYRQGVWVCRECGQVMSRTQYLNHIGAEPPGIKCFDDCEDNYPLCKKWCSTYDIDPNDPMLD